jgi:hypothetical protein
LMDDELREAYEDFDRCCRALEQAIEATKGPMTEGRRRALTAEIPEARRKKDLAEQRLRSLLIARCEPAFQNWLEFDARAEGKVLGDKNRDAVSRLKQRAQRLIAKAFKAGWLAARNVSVGEIVKLRRQVEQAAKKAQSQADKLERIEPREFRRGFDDEEATASEEQPPAEVAAKLREAKAEFDKTAADREKFERFLQEGKEAFARVNRAAGWAPGAICTNHGIADCLKCRDMAPDKWAKPEDGTPREIAEAEAKVFCPGCGERHISGIPCPDDMEPENAEAAIEQALADIRSGNLGDITRAIVILAEVDKDGILTPYVRVATKNRLEILGLLAAAFDDALSFPTRKADRG